MALQTSPATCRYPGIMRLYPGASREGRTETRPYQKPEQTKTEPEFEFSAKRRLSAFNSQLRLRPIDQIPASRTSGLEKSGKLRRGKERKERGQGKEVNKVSCSLLVRALWPVVHIRRRPGTKGSHLQPLGPICSHWQASWLLSTLSGQDISRREESCQSCHLLQEGGPLPGPKTGLLSNTWK